MVVRPDEGRKLRTFGTGIGRVKNVCAEQLRQRLYKSEVMTQKSSEKAAAVQSPWTRSSAVLVS